MHLPTGPNRLPLVFGMMRTRTMNKKAVDDQCYDQKAQQRRDKLLLRLLKAPPQPRPKRERGEKKPTRTRASRASAGKHVPSA
jgi:hypothetical protein